MPTFRAGMPTPVDQAVHQRGRAKEFPAVDILTLLPFIVLIGAMFLMTRSAKKKQQAAAQMRDQMQPGTGVRTIGGLYATVKEVNDDTVLLEAAPGVHLVFAKNAIGAVLADDEYNRIVHGDDDVKTDDATVVPDDVSSLSGDAAADEATGSDKIDLGKKAGTDADDAEAKDADTKDADAKDGKTDGEADAK